jgi:hypothetical protein
MFGAVRHPNKTHLCGSNHDRQWEHQAWRDDLLRIAMSFVARQTCPNEPRPNQNPIQSHKKGRCCGWLCTACNFDVRNYRKDIMNPEMNLAINSAWANSVLQNGSSSSPSPLQGTIHCVAWRTTSSITPDGVASPLRCLAVSAAAAAMVIYCARLAEQSDV